MVDLHCQHGQSLGATLVVETARGSCAQGVIEALKRPIDRRGKLSVYIPWAAEAQLSEPTTGRTFIGSLRDCVWTYLELSNEARRETLIICDATVPLDGTRASKVLEKAEIEWLINRLGNDIYRPLEANGRWT